MKKIALIIPFFLLLVCNFSFAASSSPVSMLQTTANKMTSSLKANNSRIKRDPNYLYTIVRRILLPKVNLEVMSRSVVGRNYWNSANKAQRQQFKKEFTRFVTRTYSAALSSYKDEKIVVHPLRGGVAGRSRVQVYCDIYRSQGPKIPVSYRLLKSGSRWMIYDFSVEGVSMVQSYRSQFASVLSQGGMNRLLKQLKTHNRKGRS